MSGLWHPMLCSETLLMTACASASQNQSTNSSHKSKTTSPPDGSSKKTKLASFPQTVRNSCLSPTDPKFVDSQPVLLTATAPAITDIPQTGDRFAAQELTKRSDVNGFTRKGFILQALAAAYHHKSPAQLAEIGNKVGRDRIQILHGTGDNLITVPHSEVLFQGLQRMGGGDGGEDEGQGEGKGEVEGVRKRIWEGGGHYLPIEERQAFNETIMELVQKTEEMH